MIILAALGLNVSSVQTILTAIGTSSQPIQPPDVYGLDFEIVFVCRRQIQNWPNPYNNL
jgi:hypothetical protein